MKGLKALKQLPVKTTIKTTVDPTNKNSKYYRSKDYYAYTASVATTNIGEEVLVVCLYGCYQDHKSRKRKLDMPILERHFLSASGELAADRYLSDFTTKPGQFTITTSDISGGWDVSDAVSSLRRESSPQHYISIDGADKVILDFAKKHKLYKKAKHTSWGWEADKNPKDFISGLCWLAAYQWAYKDKKAELAKERLEERTFIRMKQIKADPYAEFSSWLEENYSPAPWFYKYQKGEAVGICGACEKTASIPNVKNKKRGKCPHCGRPIQYISIKNGDQDIYYSLHATLIEQISDSEFVNRFFDVGKRYYSDGPKVGRGLALHEKCREFWSVKKGEIVKTGTYNSVYSWNKQVCNWKRVYPRYGATAPGYIYPGNIIEITKSLSKMFGAPRLENMDLRPLFDNNRYNAPTRIFQRAIAMPSVESMGKMGLYRLAEDCIALSGTKRFETGSPAKQLGVDKLVLKKFIEIDITLEQYNLWKETGCDLNDFEDFRSFTGNYPNQIDSVRRIFCEYNFIKFSAAVRYLDKQREKFELHAYDVVMYWKDYLDMAKAENLDLKHNKALLYPENVKKEHDRYSDLKELIKSQHLEQGLAFRAELLDNLAFSDDDFRIIPLRCVQDFLTESNELNHCVKTYAERCSRGQTNILGLRKSDEPDKPYFTVNIDNNGNLIQNRGKNNCSPPKEVKAFVNKWLKFVEKQLKSISLRPSDGNNMIRIKIGA